MPAKGQRPRLRKGQKFCEGVVPVPSSGLLSRCSSIVRHAEEYCPRCEVRREARDKLRSVILPNWEEILQVVPPPPELEPEPEPALDPPEPIRPPKTAKDPLGTHHVYVEEARAYLRGLVGNVGPNRK